jgi:hypothetical protein
VTEYKHYIYDSESFVATNDEIACQFIMLSEWLAQFHHDTVYMRLPPKLEFDQDFSTTNRMGHVYARLTVIKRAEDDHE